MAQNDGVVRHTRLLILNIETKITKAKNLRNSMTAGTGISHRMEGVKEKRKKKG
jgi:hypothetical protein